MWNGCVGIIVKGLDLNQSMKFLERKPSVYDLSIQNMLTFPEQIQIRKLNTKARMTAIAIKYGSTVVKFSIMLRRKTMAGRTYFWMRFLAAVI